MISKVLAFICFALYSVTASATIWGPHTPLPTYYFTPAAWENATPEAMMIVFGMITMMIIVGYCLFLIFEQGRKRDAEVAEMHRRLELYKNVQ